MYIPLYLYSFFAQIFEFPIREDSNACCTASLTFGDFVQNVCRIQSRPCRRHRVHQTETITRVQIHLLYNRYGYSRGSFAIPNDLFSTLSFVYGEISAAGSHEVVFSDWPNLSGGGIPRVATGQDVRRADRVGRHETRARRSRIGRYLRDPRLFRPARRGPPGRR